MTKIAVYIDERLPIIEFEKLKQGLSKEKLFDLVTFSKATVVLKYAHNENLLLNPLEKFNLNVNEIKTKKVIFFSWFDFNIPAQTIAFLLPYFKPSNSDLKNPAMCNFVQLPTNFEDVKLIIEKIIK